MVGRCLSACYLSNYLMRAYGDVSYPSNHARPAAKNVTYGREVSRSPS